MEFQFTPYLLPIIIAAVIPGGLAFYAWRHRRTRGALPFAIMMLALSEWGATYLLEMAATELPAKVLWATLEYPGIVVSTLAWFAFALEYTGREGWLTRNRLALVCLVPSLTLTLVATNASHHLFWTQFEMTAAEPFLVLVTTRGVGFWVHAAYSYLLLLLGTILIVQALVRQPPLYRGQGIGLLIGAFTPWASNIITIFGLVPTLLDLTPFAFTITGLAMGWSIFRYRLLDLMPVARDTIIESMSDGMIVLDAQNRVVDLNRASEQTLGVKAAQVIGRSAGEVFRAWPDLIERYRNTFEARDEIALGEDAAKRHFELRLSPLKDRRGGVLGRVVTVRDITEAKQAEAAVREAETRYQTLVEQLPAVLYIDHADESGTNAYISPQVEALLGYSPTEWMQNPTLWHKIIHPNDYKRAVETVNITLTQGHSNEEYRLLTRDGRIVWVRDEAVLIRDVNGQPKFVQGILRDVTGRKQAEAMLSRQATRLTTLYQLSQDIVASLDVEQICAVAHRAVEQLMPVESFFIASFEEAQQEVQDLYLFDRGRRWPNERDPISRRGMTARVIRSGEPLWIEDDLDGSITKPMGRVLFGEPEDTRSVLVAPLKLGGKTIGVISAQHYSPNIYSAEDVQVLVSLGNQVAVALENARLVQSLRLQAAALEAAADTIVITDRSGLIQWANPAFTRLTGYSLNEALGQPTSLLKSGQHDQAFYETLWKSILSGQVWEGEIVNRRKDGQLYFEEQSITPVRDANNEITHFVSIKQDITERKRAEETLHRQNQHLNALYQITLDLLNRRDLDNLLQTITDRALELLDASISYLALAEGDKLVDRVVSPPDAPYQKRTWQPGDDSSTVWRVFESRRPLMTEHYSRLPRLRPQTAALGVEAAILLPIMAGETCLGVLGVGRTKPGHMFDEENTRTFTLFAQLAALVLVNTNLYNALAQARDQALDASRLKSQLLARVSHELRTPLGAILGYAELLLHTGAFGTLTPQHKKAVGEIIDSTHDLTDLVNELLDEAQLEARAVSLRIEPFAPKEMLQKVEAQMSVLAVNKGLRFSTILAPNLPARLFGDETRLRQMLINLIGNAIKFTRGGVVRASLYCPDSEHWAMEVTDTGPGIPREAQRYIFEPFRQADGSITRSHGGTGLGLSIVKHLADLMGGTVTLDSELGRGSTFTVVLPLASMKEVVR